MEKYPFTKCLNPRRIINPYTREPLVVECGSCPSCLLRKSSLNAMKVKLESLSHKYAMFVTLTYANPSLPRMLVKACNSQLDDCGEVFDTREPFALVDVTQRLGTQGTILGYTPDYCMCNSMLSKKVNLPKGLLPHLSKYDAQLFIKRLRRNISKFYEKEEKEVPKIRYYLVGEYGPVHFRPHYHVILWFDDDKLKQIIREIIHKSWPFGRIDCQTSLGKCSDYVAKYLNCSVSLPDVFKCKQVRPFSIHSAHLGEKVFEKTREEIYQGEFDDIIKRRIPYISADSDIFLWRSLKTYYFPKCKGYAEKSERERIYSYSTYVKVYRWTGETCVAEQTRFLVFHILARFYKLDIADDIYYVDDTLLDYFEKSSMFDPYTFEKKSFNEHIEDVARRIYMELRLSKHFHRFVCKGFTNLYKPMISKIDDFWSNNDMMNLSCQLKDESEYGVSDWFCSEEDYQFFFHNCGFDVEKFKKLKAYRTYRESSLKNAEYAVKHKRLNDINKIFENK